MPFNSKSNKASSPLVKIEDVPDVPTIGTAVTGPEEALVAFTPAITGGKAALYRALSTPGSIEGVGATSPILVTGLEAGTSYTFQVRGETNLGATTGYSSASNAVVPETSGAYELIESNILSSSASSVTFSSIPQDYKHLQIRATARNDDAATLRQLWVRANADTGSNYSAHYMFGNGSTVGSSALTTDTAMKLQFSAAANNDTGTFAGLVLDFLDYSSTSKNTTMRGLSGHAGGSGNFVVLSSGLWQNTAAVTSLTLVTASGSLITGSRFSLYGIRG